ncbi:MAG: hypothetical protein JO010_12710, partial [Alphaproteobacteria bacterium]|nr:hypothetical protein [Alphaproteobacteria bacterium]
GGATVTFGPIAVGGAFEHVTNVRSVAPGAPGGGGLGQNTLDVGAAYTMGPFSVSLDASKGWYRGFAGAGGGSVCVAACGATSTLATEELVLNYVLGPGVALGAAVEFDQYRSGIGAIAGNAASNNYHDVAILTGTAITF